MQIQMLRLLLFHPRLSWPPTVSSVKYATKGSRGTRTFSFIGGVTTFHGSYDRGQTKRFGRRYISVQRRPVSTTTPPGLSETSPE